EIPKPPSDSVRGKDIQLIIEPGQKNVVGCFVEAAAFPAMDTDALFCQIDPWLVKRFQRITAERFTIDYPGPYRKWSIVRILPHPSGAVMGYIMGVVAAAALADG